MTGLMPSTNSLLYEDEGNTDTDEGHSIQSTGTAERSGYHTMVMSG